MREWESLLREKLGTLRVSRARLDDIITEMAAHLDDLWQQQQSAGKATISRAEFLGAQLGDVARLRGEIERIERSGDGMKQRIKQFWMPALLALCLAQLAVPALIAFQPRAPRYRMGQYFMRFDYETLAKTGQGSHFPATSVYVLPALVLDYGALASFVLIGGLAAFLARRMGSGRLDAFLAGVAPLLWFVPFGICLAIGAKPELPANRGVLFFYNVLLAATGFSAGAWLFSLVPAATPPVIGSRPTAPAS